MGDADARVAVLASDLYRRGVRKPIVESCQTTDRLEDGLSGCSTVLPRAAKPGDFDREEVGAGLALALGATDEISDISATKLVIIFFTQIRSCSVRYITHA